MTPEDHLERLVLLGQTNGYPLPVPFVVEARRAIVVAVEEPVHDGAGIPLHIDRRPGATALVHRVLHVEEEAFFPGRSATRHRPRVLVRVEVAVVMLARWPCHRAGRVTLAVAAVPHRPLTWRGVDGVVLTSRVVRPDQLGVVDEGVGRHRARVVTFGEPDHRGEPLRQPLPALVCARLTRLFLYGHRALHPSAPSPGTRACATGLNGDTARATAHPSPARHVATCLLAERGIPFPFHPGDPECARS